MRIFVSIIAALAFIGAVGCLAVEQPLAFLRLMIVFLIGVATSEIIVIRQAVEWQCEQQSAPGGSHLSRGR